MSISLKRRIAQLREQHGTLRAAARAIRVDAGYLLRLAIGQKTAPTSEVLHKMGLRRVVTYERLAARKESKT